MNLLGINSKGVFSTTQEVTEPVGQFNALLAATANQLLVTAVPGFRIVVLSFSANSAGLASYVGFKNGSGGAIRHFFLVPANTANPPNVQFDLNIAPGYFKTDAGVGLYADTGAVAVNLNFQYMLVRD